MENIEQNNFGIKDLVRIIKFWYRYLLTKWLTIVIVTLIMGVLGIFYSTTQLPIYTAEIIFVSDAESSSKLGGYASIAAQFGLDIGGNSNAFQGDNLLELFKSKDLIKKTLLSKIKINTKSVLLLEFYVNNWELSKKWANNPYLSSINLNGDWSVPERKRDSILGVVVKQILKNGLNINFVNKDVSIISSKMFDINEVFAKSFIEILTQKTVDFYVDYKSDKSKQNVDILQKQTDSIKALLSGNIESVAIANDVNINPIKQKARTSVQRKQIDLQASSAMYIELLKNLELSKINLRKETPLIKIIDFPTYPLDVVKTGRIKGFIIFAFLGFFIVSLFFVAKKIVT